MVLSNVTIEFFVEIISLSDTTISLLFSDPSFREIYENGFASLFITDLNRSGKLVS